MHPKITQETISPAYLLIQSGKMTDHDIAKAKAEMEAILAADTYTTRVETSRRKFW